MYCACIISVQCLGSILVSTLIYVCDLFLIPRVQTMMKTECVALSLFLHLVKLRSLSCIYWSLLHQEMWVHLYILIQTTLTRYSVSTKPSGHYLEHFGHDRCRAVYTWMSKVKCIWFHFALLHYMISLQNHISVSYNQNLNQNQSWINCTCLAPKPVMFLKEYYMFSNIKCKLYM